MPEPPPIVVVLYGPGELQRLAPLAEQYRSPPQARLIDVVVVHRAAVPTMLRESFARRPLELPRRLRVHQRAKGVAAAAAAGEERWAGNARRGRDPLAPAAEPQPACDGGEEEGHGIEHGVMMK